MGKKIGADTLLKRISTYGFLGQYKFEAMVHQLFEPRFILYDFLGKNDIVFFDMPLGKVF